jgi:hypothetical protein
VRDAREPRRHRLVASRFRRSRRLTRTRNRTTIWL